MMDIEIPEGADLIFNGLAQGDEDFFSEQCGHLNISRAYRELKRAGAVPIQCHVPRSDLSGYRATRDIDEAHVARIKANGPEALARPVLLGELEPKALTLIDGIHRLIANAEMNPSADPIRLQAYVIPFAFLRCFQVQVYFQFTDGRREPIDHAKYLAWSWGKYTAPGESNGQRSAC